MPLQLLSRSTITDTIRSRSPSPLTTPASKLQIPTVRLTTATPRNTNQTHDASQVISSVTSEASPVAIAPKPNGGTSRKRLVPKKSKLGLLGPSASSAKAREQDFSDVVRRVGSAVSVQNGSNGFEIYVDPANDPDIGEILMVKKRKSRLALDGLQWGTLGEVTNVPSATKPKEKGVKKESLLKMKVDENQKWWSIGRGRKDSKEKGKDKVTENARSPQPSDKPTDVRAHFNSLGSGILPTSPLYDQDSKFPVEYSRVLTRSSATPAPPDAAGSGGGKDSVAIRAMRSVRSLARIGSWAQLKNTPNPDAVVAAAPSAKDREPDKKKKRGKDKDKIKETVRYSGSSFEAGALTASPPASTGEAKSLGKKKASILGLGWPSTMRLPTTRSVSTASANTANRRLSVDSSRLLGSGVLARGRSSSTMSTSSSLRPMSAKSCISRKSSDSSGTVSVRWDEAGLRTAKEIRRREKEARNKERAEEKGNKEKRKSRKSKDSTRKLSDGRKRTPLSAIFPGTASEMAEQQPVTSSGMIERATMDVHEPGQHATEVYNSPIATPVKPVCSRPVSEQPLSRSRPKAFYEREEDNVAISLLDAATNDLAQLINKLDLEATPGSVEMTPISQRPPLVLDPSANHLPSGWLTTESPIKILRHENSSVTSLRPYAGSCSKSTGVQLGQNIAPWSTLNAGISPSKHSPSVFRVDVQDNTATVRTHGGTLTPAPSADPSPVFKALRPATSRLPMSKTMVGASSGISPFVLNVVDRSPSSLTFGSGHFKSESHESFSVSPVFKKANGRTRKGSSLVSRAELDNGNLSTQPEVHRSLGLAGTMGNSVGIAEQDYDRCGPNSDIPDESQVILSNSDQEEDTISFDRQSAHLSLPSPGLPPETPLPVLDPPSARSSVVKLPVFRATVIDEDEHHVDVEEIGASPEDDTKRSFDFTGELQKLNESGASDRRSFIEQLENAFRTPAKIDLRYDFGDLPPVPRLPTLQDELFRTDENSFGLPMDYESPELLPSGFPIDINAEPSLLPISDSFATTASDEELLNVMVSQVLQQPTAVASQPSNGQLNRDFKFGGKHSLSEKKASPLTLSDIIPPPEIARSLSMASFAADESSLMKSILAHAIQIESPVCPLDSNWPSKPEAREAARKSFIVADHQRSSSMLSFSGFDSFAEIRRGFEYHDNRPGFYPPLATMSARRQRKHESIYSIASVSSYGNVLHGGAADPFDYGSLARLPSLRERPSSDNFSLTMPTSVDDTFSFIHRPPPRRRVDSDTSSFYFRMSSVHPYRRSNRRPESGVSVGLPNSLFNRNSTCHRRGDSNASISSVAQSYANCRRFSWGRHRPNLSGDSVIGELTEIHLGRPGLGDKMLESARGCVSPLASISASPAPSLAGSTRGERIYLEEYYDNRTSYDSIMDSQHVTQKTDSLFEKTGHRNSVCSSDSTFFEEHRDNDAAKLPRYRPISSLSIPSVHSSPKEDDTMISMLGGGHIRRRSVTSMIGASPCIQVERRKNIVANPPETVFDRIKNAHPGDYESPEVSRVIGPKPSIASTVNSFKFGDERMIRARHGLLERQSLEDNALMGEGEDLSGSTRMPVFVRPSRANHSRSSTCTSSSGVDTPPLSISDGYSSFSEGSLSSIDLSQLNNLFSSATQPLSNAAFDRAHPRGHGHRRRISQARASRTSIYETIEEEATSSFPYKCSSQQVVQPSPSNTPKPSETTSKIMDPSPVFIVDPETSSMDSFSLWDDEKGIIALRRYYALRDEAEDAVTESKRAWLDTPFSVFTVQSFEPPRHPAGMQAMLQHSLQNFGPLPTDLRPRRARSRVNSRPSPYPRTVKTSFTPSPGAENLQAMSFVSSVDNIGPCHPPPLSNALQQISIDPNVPSTLFAESKECVISPDKLERVLRLPPHSRFGSATKRAALGWSKKSTGRSGTENKENTISNIGQTTVNVSQGTIISPVNGLRLNRPRPRGRPTQASARPLRR